MKERIFVMIKPDGVRRGLAGEIIKRFENAGMKIIAMKICKATPEQVEKLYPEEMALGIAEKTKKAFDMEGKEFPWSLEEYGMIIVGYLRKYINGSCVVPIVIEGDNAVDVVRRTVGATDPSRAEKGSIRGDFGNDSYEKANAEKRAVQNLVHVADRERIAAETKIWFKKREIVG